MKTQRAHQPGSAEYYEKLGVQKGVVAQWEDGYRAKGVKGAFEWWYFDSHLENGASLVITFFAPNGKRGKPRVDMDYTDAAGVLHSERVTASVDAFSSDTERCNVRFGECTFAGDLHHYDIYVKNEAMEVRVALDGNVPAWRDKTGCIYFGDHDEDNFAWLPAVPEGNVTAEITLDGQTTRIGGTGYHDHNWGSSMLKMLKMINNWYWGRAKVGEYQVISSYITAGKTYGYKRFPIFMLAKNGQLLVDGAGDALTFTSSDPYIDKDTGKCICNRLVYDYKGGKQHYRVTYEREADIVNKKDGSGILRWLMRLFGVGGGYKRFSGVSTVECFNGANITESVSAPAIWEYVCMGKTPPDEAETVKARSDK